MIIDSSAIIAILLGEPENEQLANAIASDPKRLVCAVTALECSIVIQAKKGDAGTRELDLLLHQAQIQTVEMNNDQVSLAREAYNKYGKGQHPAGLNLGDCCSYALSAYLGEPLLYKGNDFSQTDIIKVRDLVA
jgi:ribonuclease VapC